MRSFIKNLFGKKTKPIRSKPTVRNKVQLGVLALEERALMSVTAISLAGGTLSITASEGNDDVCVRVFDDVIQVDGGGAFNLTDVQRVEFFALGGNDTIRLHGGPSGATAALTTPATVHLGAGNDTLFGGTASDVIFGGSGDDTIIGGSGNDYLDGGSGADFLQGDSGADKLHGDIGNDILHGGIHADELAGGDGTDALHGNDGNDRLDGGAGNDILFGNAGADTIADDFSGTTHDTNVLEDTRQLSHFAWFDMNSVDAAVREVARFAARDGFIDRADMLKILDAAGDGTTVTSDEHADLMEITTAAPVTMSDPVRNLSKKVVFGNVANANYQGAALGNLSAGASVEHLEKLVNKWFLGMDHPEAKNAAGTVTYAYKLVKGDLYQNGISQTDVDQGAVGDCYFLASLATAAQQSPSVIQNMITDNGDGTFTVRFFKTDGTADYVTVDRYLPVTSTDYFAFANNSSGLKFGSASNELWCALVEKAYAQINESGWIGQDGTNSYQGISGGGFENLQQITGLNYTLHTVSVKQDLIDALNAGKLVTISTKDAPPKAGIFGTHRYAVQSFNATTNKFRLYNPHGGANAYIDLTWAELQDNFDAWGKTA